MAHGEALDVHLVDDRLVPGPLVGPGAAPGEGGVDHLALGHERRAVALVERQIALGIADPVAEQRVVPAQLAGQRLGVGVDQQLVVVEAMAGFGLVGAVDPVAVELPRAHVRQVAVPDLVGELRQRHPCRLGLAVRVEQAELDLLRVRRKQREIGPGAIPGGAQRIGQTRPDSKLLRGHAAAPCAGGAALMTAPEQRRDRPRVPSGRRAPPSRLRVFRPPPR